RSLRAGRERPARHALQAMRPPWPRKEVSKMRTFIPVLAATALLAAGAATAADPATPAPVSQREMRAERHAAMGERLFERLDANQDGRISRAEYQAWVDQ